MSIGNEISRSHEGPEDVEKFPPRWAYEHLSDEEYDRLRRKHYAKYGPAVCPKCGNYRRHSRVNGYYCTICDRR